MPSVPREKYPEMNWRAADKVAAWKVFRRRMEVIFVADQIPEERQWALILLAGGDEAYNRWDTLEDTVQNRKKVEQVWIGIREELRTINFILAFQRHVPGRLQAGRVGNNG